MPTVLIDNQVFENQKFGGISRYFSELQKGIPEITKMENFRAPARLPESFSKRFLSKIGLRRTKIYKNNPSKYDFYRTQLRALDFDIFHPTYYDNYFLETLEKPFVLTVHDMIHEKYPEYFGASPDSINKRKLCLRADKIIAISETTKKDIIDIFDIKEDKIEVIYHGTNFDLLPAAKPNFPFQEKKYLLYTGNRSNYKNFLVFILAIAPILRNYKSYNLVCTGPEFSSIEKKWIKDLSIEESVMHYYTHNDNELVYLYQHAECFVFPSLYEGFGLPLLEAFACNCPVVSSSGGSLKEIAGDAALYFHPKDILGIRNSIETVLSDNSLRNELILKGKERLKNFSWENCQKKTKNLYSDILMNND